jgi:hypothetical protein
LAENADGDAEATSNPTPGCWLPKAERESPRSVEEPFEEQNNAASWWSRIMPRRVSKNMVLGGLFGLVFVPLPGAMATGIALGHQVIKFIV